MVSKIISDMNVMKSSCVIITLRKTPLLGLMEMLVCILVPSKTLQFVIPGVNVETGGPSDPHCDTIKCWDRRRTCQEMVVDVNF